MKPPMRMTAPLKIVVIPVRDSSMELLIRICVMNIIIVIIGPEHSNVVKKRENRRVINSQVFQ